MKKIILSLFIGLSFLNTIKVNAQYGKDFYLQPYTINSPVSTPETMAKIDLDSAVVTVNYGVIQGAELNFSVRHADGRRATYGFTATYNGRFSTGYMNGHAKLGSFYRLYSSFYDPYGRSQGTATGGRWAP